MKDKKFTAKDDILMALSVGFFAAAVFTTVASLSYVSIGCFCLFGCSLLLLVRRQTNRPVPEVTESEEYIELKKAYLENKKVSDVRIHLLTSKLDEGNREKKQIMKQYEDMKEHLEEVQKNLQKTTQSPKQQSSQSNVQKSASMAQGVI